MPLLFHVFRRWFWLFCLITCISVVSNDYLNGKKVFWQVSQKFQNQLKAHNGSYPRLSTEICPKCLESYSRACALSTNLVKATITAKDCGLYSNTHQYFNPCAFMPKRTLSGGKLRSAVWKKYQPVHTAYRLQYLLFHEHLKFHLKGEKPSRRIFWTVKGDKSGFALLF